MELSKDIIFGFCVLLTGIVGWFLRDMWASRRQTNLVEAVAKLEHTMALLTQKFSFFAESYVTVSMHNSVVLKIALIEEQLKSIRG